jgi:hypothetical protein
MILAQIVHICDLFEPPPDEIPIRIQVWFGVFFPLMFKPFTRIRITKSLDKHDTIFNGLITGCLFLNLNNDNASNCEITKCLGPAFSFDAGNLIDEHIRDDRKAGNFQGIHRSSSTINRR